MSGGGNTFNLKEQKEDKLRDNVDILLLKFALSKKIPILGICRGMQFLNCFFGGTISQIRNHVGNEHEIILNTKLYNFPNIVNSFHGFGIKRDNLASNFSSIALDKNGNIESFIDSKKKVFGIMWHPERDVKNIKLYSLFFKKWFK